MANLRLERRAAAEEARRKALRHSLAQSAATRHANQLAAGLLVTLVDDPVITLNGRPYSAAQLLKRCEGKHTAWADAREERDATARAAAAREAAAHARVESQLQARAERAAAERAAKADAAAAKAAKAAAKAKRIAKARERAVIEAGIAAAAARRFDRRDANAWTSAWARWAGKTLEASMSGEIAGGEPAVRLIDARYLIELAERGGVLPRRQNLPEDAFLDLAHVRHMTETGFGGGALRVIAVSHAWLQPDQPDPRGDTLRALAAALTLFVEDTIFGFPGTFGVLLDYASLMQPAIDGTPRTDDEQVRAISLTHLTLISHLHLPPSHRLSSTARSTRCGTGTPILASSPSFFARCRTTSRAPSPPLPRAWAPKTSSTVPPPSSDRASTPTTNEAGRALRWRRRHSSRVRSCSSMCPPSPLRRNWRYVHQARGGHGLVWRR